MQLAQFKRALQDEKEEEMLLFVQWMNLKKNSSHSVAHVVSDEKTSKEGAKHVKKWLQTSVTFAQGIRAKYTGSADHIRLEVPAVIAQLRVACGKMKSEYCSRIEKSHPPSLQP